jgi:hypothetical protein
MKNVVGVGVAVAGTCLVLGCELWGAPWPDPDCESVAIDSDAELLVSSLELRRDTRARNANLGTFSFAEQWRVLTARYPALDAAAFWNIVGVEGASADAARAPFRLLAVVNRTDLAEQLAPESPAGEARLVYTLTAGPGDDPSRPALPLTVIFEYSLGRARNAAEWARDFHALAALPSAERLQALETLARSFIDAEDASPDAPSLSQIRVNDGRGGVPVLHELAVEEGALRRRGLRNTPRPELAVTQELAAFVRDNAAAISAGTHRVPTQWLASSAAVGRVTWLAPGDPELERSFSRATCSGCHGADGPGAEGFHVAATSSGQVVLSSFLTDEDLPRRSAVMRANLCDTSAGR